MSVLLKYLEKVKVEKTVVKVFLESSGQHAKTMLKGKVRDYDDESIVLDECLVFLDRVISIAPFE